MATWDDLGRRETVSEPSSFEETCALALSTPAGRDLMKALKQRYIEAVKSGSPSDSALRELNAKRQVVRELEVSTERGLEKMKTQAK